MPKHKLSQLHCFFPVMLCIFLFSTSAKSQLVVNEYQCSNMNTATDAYGDYEDWVELYNPSAAAINVTGYYLSDKTNNPTKWQMPGGSVPAGGYLLIFANGKDRIVGNELHAGFKLTQTKPEHIVLSDASGVVISDIEILANKVDESHGLETDGNGTWKVFTSPTPGSSNGTGTLNYALTPIFTQAPGNYSGSVAVEITTT